MLVNGKMMAFSGLALALTVVLMVLGGILEWNTLFFLGAASFFVGIVIREFGLGYGAAFYIAAVLLGFILAPNKFYCVTFSAMGFYIVSMEWVWRFIGKRTLKHNRKLLFWAFKYVIFNLMFIPGIIFFPKLLFPGKIDAMVIWLAVIGGQAALFLYDRAYEYFQVYIWGKFRKRIM